jgi:glycine hydroxymethyltransferase
MSYDYIQKQDSDASVLFQGEEGRENTTLELIPSENYVSKAVREALGSSFTNKYSEGYPGKRYYGGQEFTDQIELLAIERAQNLFDARFVNVQPLGGANANIALYFALLNPGDTILGMDLSHGGHLTHGHPVTYLSKLFNFVRYKMKNVETGEIDYDELEQIAKQHTPKIILAGFSSYPRNLDYARISHIARSVGAISVMDAAHIAGLIAGQALPNPFGTREDPWFDVITTTTHKTLRGPRGGMIMTREDAHIASKVDKSVFPGLQGGPHMNVVGAKAVAFYEALQPQFQQYAQATLENSRAMAEVFQGAGIKMITGGTSNHLILIDVVTSFGMGGKEAQSILDRCGITTNMNVIPNDERKALDPSGIRLGTPAITTRRFDRNASKDLARLIIDCLQGVLSEKVTRERVVELAHTYPIPDSFM